MLRNSEISSAYSVSTYWMLNVCTWLELLFRAPFLTTYTGTDGVVFGFVAYVA